MNQPSSNESYSATRTEEIVFDVPPINENGRTLVLVRSILEPLGASFNWDSNAGVVTAVKGSTEVKLKINSKLAIVNGKEVVLEVPAKITKGRTLVPLRFISESLGYKVDWNPATTEVKINNQYYFYLDTSKQPKSNSESKTKNGSEFFVGQWEIWVPGGFATTGSTLNGDGSKTIEQEYVKGAKGKILSIKAEGSYSWEVVGGTINGTWIKPYGLWINLIINQWLDCYLLLDLLDYIAIRTIHLIYLGFLDLGHDELSQAHIRPGLDKEGMELEYLSGPVSYPRPQIFGLEFEGLMGPHGPGEPWHFDKHIWLHSDNPFGVDAQWNPNPDCSCHPATQTDDGE